MRMLIAASIPSGLNVRVELFQFYSGIFGGELPVDAHLFLVAFKRPGGRAFGYCRQAAEVVAQRLPRQNAQALVRPWSTNFRAWEGRRSAVFVLAAWPP